MTYFNNNGTYQAEYDTLSKALVPDYGKADTMDGNLLRAGIKISHEYYNNGFTNFFDDREFYIGMLKYYADEIDLKHEIKYLENIEPNDIPDEYDENNDETGQHVESILDKIVRYIADKK